MANTNQNQTGPLSLQEMLALAGKAETWTRQGSGVVGQVDSNINYCFEVVISPKFWGKHRIEVRGRDGYGEFSIGEYSCRNPALKNLYAHLSEVAREHDKHAIEIASGVVVRVAQEITEECAFRAENPLADQNAREKAMHYMLETTLKMIVKPFEESVNEVRRIISQ